MPQIAEIKARSNRIDEIREVLIANHASLKGIDHQVDTYFKVPDGRLKLRQGTVENNLIFYNRPNTTTPKKSSVQLYQPNNSEDLKTILTAVHGVLCIVNKKREIFFIDNVKFHLDTVHGLGTFVEIEAIDSDGSLEYAIILEQCNSFMKTLDIMEDELISVSYSDLIMQTSTTHG